MDAVCFDMDGVVVDSERHWAPLEDERILPWAAPSAAVTASDVAGMNVEDLYDHLSREHDTAVSKAAFLDRYDEVAEELYAERASLLDGFEDLAAACRDASAAVALVSNSPVDWVDVVVDRFGLAATLDATVSAGEIDGPGKPDPAVYRHAATALGVDPGRCVAVEDSAHGVEAARAAGMHCVGYRAAANREQDLSGADAVADGPADLRERLLAAVA